MENTTDRRFRSGTLEMRVFHLEEEIFSSQQEIVLDKGEKRKLSLEWQPPETDFQGYVISLEITDGKERHIAQDTIGADVSSSWVKFPRYGYVCSYEEKEEAAEKIALMNRYHINAIEYYDWQAAAAGVHRRGGGRLGGLVRPEDIRKYHKRLHTGREGKGHGKHGL